MSVARARALRKTMTPQEVTLWVRLRELRGLGYHPRRQAPIGRYVVDFVFRRQGLAIEVDGGQHGEGLGADQDRVRDGKLGDLGYRVLRFWNTDVDQNLDGVVETIIAALEERAADPSPCKGEGGPTRSGGSGGDRSGLSSMP